MTREDVITALDGCLYCTRSMKSPLVHISIPVAEAILQMLKESEIVRCVECEHWVEYLWECGKVDGKCKNECCRPDWFCGDGKRKTGRSGNELSDGTARTDDAEQGAEGDV